MWQLKKLSTNEALGEAGPLPNNWGPIFGLSGIQDKLNDLSWIGPAYSDKGWVKLSEEEQKQIQIDRNMARLSKEKEVANNALNNPLITVESKSLWLQYLKDLDTTCLCADFNCDPKFPSRPNA